MHGGYFSDPAIAAPLLRAVRKSIAAVKPDVVVDLGGGTGFLLERLAGGKTDPGLRLVNLDISRTQLDTRRHGRVESILGLVHQFDRKLVACRTEDVLLMMRSVLHYYGRKGLGPTLHHLRSQMKCREMFVHQTACFENTRHAECLNDLYEAMGTGKWYATVSALSGRIEEAGWRVEDIMPAPPLALASGELGMRYGLSRASLSLVRARLLKKFGEIDGVFQLEPNGFRMFLHYRVFSCVAARR